MLSKYHIDQIGTSLRAARQAKGLTQRELGAASGVPQSHISKIESGAVDLRISSLVALARILDLELTLVPRKALPAVQAIVRGGATERRAPPRAVATEINRLQDHLARAAKGHRAITELAQLQRLVRDLRHLEHAIHDTGPLRDANRALRAFTDDPRREEPIREALTRVQGLRAALAHRSEAPRIEEPTPAYNLEEDDPG